LEKRSLQWPFFLTELNTQQNFLQIKINNNSSKELHNSVKTYAELNHRVPIRTRIGLLTKGEKKWEDP